MASATKSGKSAKKAKAPTKPRKPVVIKQKTVRDSFTFPESDYALFSALKRRALVAGIEIKKSELLRAGLRLLDGMDDAAFAATVGAVERVKTGRPKK